MKLRYRNSIDDLVAFTRFFYEHSPFLKQQARVMALVALCVLTGATIAFFLVIGTGTPPPPLDRVLLTSPCFALPIAAVSIVIYFVWPPYLVYRASVNTRQFYQTNPDKSALGDQELEVIAGQLVARNELCTACWKFSAIDDVATTPQHVFIRISGVRAFAIPRGEVAEDELTSFLAKLDRQRREPVAVLPAELPPSEAIQADKSSIQK